MIQLYFCLQEANNSREINRSKVKDLKTYLMQIVTRQQYGCLYAPVTNKNTVQFHLYGICPKFIGRENKMVVGSKGWRGEGIELLFTG